MESFVGCCRHRDDKKLSVGRPEEKPKSPSLFVSFSVDLEEKSSKVTFRITKISPSTLLIC